MYIYIYICVVYVVCIYIYTCIHTVYIGYPAAEGPRRGLQRSGVPGEASGAPSDAGEGGPEEVLRGAAEASPME